MSIPKIIESSLQKNGWLLLVGLVLLYGCDTGESFSLFDDQDIEGMPQPVIHEVDPPEGYLAGIDKITILGENFDPVPENNLVYFNERRGTVLSGSEEVLEVRTADVVSDSVSIRVTPVEGEKFSEKYQYRLDHAVQRGEGIASSYEPRAIEVGNDGYLYMAHVDDGSNVGIAKIDRETGDLEVIVEQTSWTYQTIRQGPDNGLYMVRPGAIPIIYKVEEGGDNDNLWAMGVPRTDDIDFDENGYLWGAGQNEGEGNDAALIRLDEDGNDELFPFDADVTALRVFEGSLYAAGSQAGELKVWRFNLGGNSEPGSPEVYFDFTGETGADDWTLHSMIFSEDGDLFIGTNGDKGVIEVAPGGTDWQHFYPDVLDPAGLSFSWKPGSEFMYMAQGQSAQSDGDLLKLNMLRGGAPQYGRD